MSKGLFLSVFASGLLGFLCILPLWLVDFSAVEIVFGRFLVFGLLILLVLPFRRDALKRYDTAPPRSRWQNGLILALTGHIGYYLFLILSIRSLGGMAAFLLVGTLPILFSLSHHSKGTHHPVSQKLALFMLFCSLVLLMFDKAALVEDSSDKDQFATGVIWLLLAGSCWMCAASRQAWIVRACSGIDRSNHLMMSGLCTSLALTVLLPLALVGEGEWRLFTRQDGRSWYIFWFGMILAGVFCTLLARVIWNNRLAYASDSVRAGAMVSEPLMIGVLFFLLETRWPDTVEWSIIALSGLALWLFYRRV
ncbi:DMT family transporter [Endozoicomonas lisbonensis]|uniref:Drug/metabolite transporter (DMT)-like permease n=2 Tax=Endozoicomonas lisbonensis TaxID=3120522 RepID=A0ABV2SKR4_9GAMM